MYFLAISVISFRANGSPPVKLTFKSDLPNVLVNCSISFYVNSPLKVSLLSKSIKQKEHLALHRFVKKWTILTGSFLENKIFFTT